MPRGIFCLLLMLSGLACAGKNSPTAVQGVLDLSEAQEPARLDGEWEFYYGRLLSPGASAWRSPELSYLRIPGVWNDHSAVRNAKPEKAGFGCATLRLRVKLPPAWQNVALKMPIASTAYRLWINGTEFARAGIVAADASVAQPENRPVLIFPESGAGKSRSEWEIILQVSNFHMPKAGMRVSLVAGPEQEMLARERRQLGLDIFVFGSLTIIGFYHLFLFLLRREDRSLAYFAVFCFAIALRTVTTGERFLGMTFPGLLSWFGETRLDFLTVSTTPVLFAMFIRELFPDEIPRWFVRALQAIGLLFALLVLVTPAHIYAQPVNGLLALYSVAGVFVLIRLLAIIMRKRRGARLFTSGFLVVFITFINDSLYANGLIHTFRMVPLGLFFLILSQAILLSVKFNREYRKIQKMSRAMTRFVPKDFLKILGHDSIENVALGDQTERVMTVLFSDLRDFTSLSEKLTPEENFRLLNSMLRRVGPVIRRHGGFIDKYIGDAIMALFPGRADDAVQAAIEMHERLREYNQDTGRKGHAALRMGVGIHTGKLMLGTIGEEERMEGTVISDAVNLASRLESETKVQRVGILISGATFAALAEPERFHIRKLGKTLLKGKSRKTLIYSVEA